MIKSVFHLIIVLVSQTHSAVNSRQFVFVRYQSWTDGQIFALNSTEQYFRDDVLQCAMMCARRPECVSVSKSVSGEKMCYVFLKSYTTRQVGKTKRNMELWIQQSVLSKNSLENIPGQFVSSN